VRCAGCHTYTRDPRKGLCVACVHRARRGAELPSEAQCEACGVSDRRVLRWVRLGDERALLCANDEARVRAKPGALQSRAAAFVHLADVLQDRRRGDRRGGLPDRRTHWDRVGRALRPAGGRRATDAQPALRDPPGTDENGGE
jgi:hypothetical protein